MKKYFFLLLLAALFSCAKPNQSPDPVPVDPVPSNVDTPITFELTAKHPQDTRVVKSGWENGDVIFVFFKQSENNDPGYKEVVSPNHLEMSYSGKGWTTTVVGTIALENTNEGVMTAVYLPFSNDATVTADNNGNYVFNNSCVSYYLTAKLDYKVENNKVSGSFAMKVPDGFVQFYVADDNPQAGSCKLATDAVFPVKVGSVSAAGVINEVHGNPGANLNGYVYGKDSVTGYLFSGKLSETYSYTDYYFSKIQVSGSESSRSDYFVTPKNALTSLDSINLPANGDAKWQAVGSDVSVDLGTVGNVTATSVGKWYTCNLGATVPESLEPLYSLSEVPSNIKTIPTKNEYLLLSSLSIKPMSIHGTHGIVVQSKSNKAFIFLPVNGGKEACYWTSEKTGDYAYHAFVNANDSTITVGDTYYSPQSAQNAVRLMNK